MEELLEERPPVLGLRPAKVVSPAGAGASVCRASELSSYEEWAVAGPSSTARFGLHDGPSPNHLFKSLDQYSTQLSHACRVHGSESSNSSRLQAEVSNRVNRGSVVGVQL